VLFVASEGAVVSVVYLWGGYDAVRGGWFRDRRVGTVLNAVTAVFVGGIVAIGAPSVWAGLVFGALAVAVVAPVLDGVVFRSFREEGAGLATMLMVALGVSFVLRFGTQAVYGGGTRRFEVPETVGTVGYETSLRAAKHFDAYVGADGLVVAVMDTATEVTVGLMGLGWFAVAVVLFAGIMENMMLAAEGQTGESALNLWLRGGGVTDEQREVRERALGRLELLEIGHLADEYAGNLSGGQRKLLELGRVLMTEPDVVLLDEPAAGVNPTLTEEITGRIEELSEEDYTFLMVEHDIDLVMSLCDEVILMDQGNKITQGTPGEAREDERVLEAYLGGK